MFEALRALHKARTEYPASIPGQQEHFARTLPAACERLEQELRDEFSGAELQTLRDVLQDMLGDEDEDHEQE